MSKKAFGLWIIFFLVNFKKSSNSSEPIKIHLNAFKFVKTLEIDLKKGH